MTLFKVGVMTVNKEPKLYLILHRIRSAYNVGSMFRTADALGVEKIFLTGFTQRPSLEEYEFQTKAEKMLSKTALGADKYVPWEGYKNISVVIKKLRKEKVKIVAVEQSADSVDYRKFSFSEDTALILGNEPRGIDKRILSKCDAIVEIPMWGKKKSLNVAVALGVVGYGINFGKKFSK